MIEEPVAFVLGAGASCPYGFPSGEGLVKEILEKLTPGSELHLGNPFIRNILRAGDGENKDEFEYLTVFRSALLDSGVMSIDAFLQYHPQFDAIGRRVIAAFLLRHERNSSLAQPRSGDWYKLLLRLLEATFEQLHRNKVSFITYNYDRSLEQFLFLAFRNREPGTGGASAWAELLRKTIPIIHLHGQLGPHPQFVEGNEEPTPYGVDLEDITTNKPIYAIKAAAKGIRIVHDDINLDKDDRFQQTYSLLSQAKRVFFLGFGYGKVNLARLRLRQHTHVGMLGTAYEMTSAEIEQITPKAGHLIEVGSSTWDCLDYIRESHWLQRHV